MPVAEILSAVVRGRSGARAAIVVTMVAGAAVVRADCPPCGPNYCLNDPRYPPALAAKKAAMERQRFPPDLIALIDKDGACFARVEQAPVTFFIRTVAPNQKLTFEWSPRDEEIARTDLLSGAIRAYYKFNVPRAFACCRQPHYDARPDYDADLDLNRSLVIECKKAGTAVQCR
jgi:hypothetical protein